MSSYDHVRGGKLTFKGGIPPQKTIKKKKSKKPSAVEQDTEKEASAQGEEESKIDTGTGFAPDGAKKTKFYEELFPVETKRFAYEAPKVQSRENALIDRIKKKADKFCK